ncbi:MAG: PD-(D/E)XK nuclease family protein [Candidatus Paceibacterota bacterium]
MDKNKKPDKYKAVWVSHSSMGDFLKCPRAYYLHNVYKDPATGHKINITSPAMSLGVAVHEVLEGLIKWPADVRSKQPLLSIFKEEWTKISGRLGGFTSLSIENEYKDRGEKMIARVQKNMGPLVNKALKLKEHENNMPPNFYLSEEDNIILCGKIDWLEYLPTTDSVHVVDFKTGKHEENEDSLQLPIYLLLLNHLQKRPVTKASYWYLETDDVLTPKTLPNVKEAEDRVLAVAKQVKTAREEGNFNCPKGKDGCFACLPFEKILKGEAEFVGVGGYGQDIYIV